MSPSKKLNEQKFIFSFLHQLVHELFESTIYKNHYTTGGYTNDPLNRPEYNDGPIFSLFIVSKDVHKFDVILVPIIETNEVVCGDEKLRLEDPQFKEKLKTILDEKLEKNILDM